MISIAAPPCVAIRRLRTGDLTVVSALMYLSFREDQLAARRAHARSASDLALCRVEDDALDRLAAAAPLAAWREAFRTLKPMLVG